MTLERLGLHWVVRDGSGKIVSRTLYRPKLDESVEVPLAVRIKNVVDALDVNDDSLWTGEGRPKMSVVEEALGDASIKRRDVTDATGDFRRPE